MDGRDGTAGVIKACLLFFLPSCPFALGGGGNLFCRRCGGGGGGGANKIGSSGYFDFRSCTFCVVCRACLWLPNGNREHV
ncbi:hypothetical protein BU24DRAFT_132497 [Aaosphaeria arxii CBS 175.79]|uniref:Secreted protein n=1 Tax=Aaosphaeria arxii CBS 175.79 TaxID=1450172 RepID=A0A6A5Y648_9PLEO|nr:uncharacterized protein BU24DRAFT_132497 [Aaosphaeria arxii CBS 175.79]KAF2020034.1 hypothetical protein BU24DRAFT_132497 [Aaosphaeria arxii CBS 175.79]